MAERIQKQKTSNDKSQDSAEVAEAVTAQGDKLKAEMDDLLDEIDEVLESNAEDFVKSYIQKGGE
ncbi:MAG: prokaryotic ubiquitin-like protein Pup [Actinomycetota bacterium]|jgi:prokaryotic ubiquitin-like protein Pup